jgi:DNA-binding transcriptional MerR regulator
MTNTYTIKDLAQLSRIKPHTLRIWEQRYNILKPQRSDSNIRQYNQEELKYLLNVAILYENGFKISHIAKLNHSDLTVEVRRLTDNQLQYPSHVQNLVLAMLDLDEDRFNRQLTSNIMSFGMEETVIQIIYPFLSHIGVLWQTNTINPAQEHFITYLIRQKLIVAIDGISNERVKPNPKKVILFLPEGELHEISLLFACFMVKYMGHTCIYLGQSLPLVDLASVQIDHKADIIFTIITSTPCQEDVQPYLKKMKEALSTGEVWLTGYQVCTQELELPENFKIIYNTLELKTLLA